MTRRRVPIALLALAAASLALVLAARVASASCGGVVTQKPLRKLHHHGRAPLAIGDSVMLLAVRKLAAEGYRVNARGCRQWSEGLSVIRHVRARHHLPHLVAIALGADWIITKGDIRQALHVVPKNRVLALVTPRETGGRSGSDATHIREAAQQHPHRVVLLDWVDYAAGHSSWFQPDGLHLTFPGADAFARLFGKALPFARPGRFPNGAQFP